MMDSFIANADIADMRAVVRTLLATSPPDVTAAFHDAARRRLDKMNAKQLSPSTQLFSKSSDGFSHPTPELAAVLRRARSLYGAGMGFASLFLLTQVVRETLGMRWKEDSDTADVLAHLDADVTQAIQSSKEELAGGRVADLSGARATMGDLQNALIHSDRDAEIRGCESPFERALASVQYWKF
ncbi:uncharacterized protein C8Q71DRAFT_784750 [Rhodofomes roseus]|uniref:Uncharacterized protein n=1 Tax=Rhodofomes roseus TaxID=34475 RepID=A0ABQ8K249_9APHY|nr:uncharacterized protein C8Q71DRAFT_784750 [Rhodofomes roseus]KAH9830825.1 hypothetical protein C8Q71DRAFT_784750 [Rhodofomes roseus]